MTENQKELAAKPQSDWDGDISPHGVAASQTDKIFATLWFMKRKLVLIQRLKLPQTIEISLKELHA